MTHADAISRLADFQKRLNAIEAEYYKCIEEEGIKDIERVLCPSIDESGKIKLFINLEAYMEEIAAK